MSQQTVENIEVNTLLADYLPERVESEEQVHQAYREATLELHPDTGNGTPKEFAKLKEESEELKEHIDRSDVDIYEINAEDNVISQEGPKLERHLEAGLDYECRETESAYELLNSASTGDGYNALISDKETALMAGLEIEKIGDRLEGEATYFTDSGGTITTNEGFIDLDVYEESTSTRPVENGLQDIARWTVRHAEEELKR